MNQTCENCKKTSFRPNFGPFGPNLAPQNFFRGFISTRLYAISKKTNEQSGKKNLVSDPVLAQIWLHHVLDIMVSHYHVQYQKKLMI